MTKALNQKTLELYHQLMIEVKARLLSINTLTNDQRGIPSPLVYEFGVLQIRMLCEIIGLACLVAHGDLVARSKAGLKEKYRPNEIFIELGKLHDDFYPVPITPTKAQQGWHMDHYVGAPFLVKSDVAKVWSLCGNVLHRGNLKQLLKANNPIQHHFSNLQDWGQQIGNLLNNHRIITLDRNQAIVCQLGDGSGIVNVVLGEALPFSTPTAP
jgi:hypothetical protein